VNSGAFFFCASQSQHKYNKISGFAKVDNRFGYEKRLQRGGYRFSSLMKQKTREKNYALFYFAGERIFLYIYL